MLKTVLNTLKKHQKDYVIYKINIGKTIYVGSTTYYPARMNQHLDLLKQKKHHNDKLQEAYLTYKQFESTILVSSFSSSKSKILKQEQRYINLFSNSNEATASKNSIYDFKEFVFDVYDLILRRL